MTENLETIRSHSLHRLSDDGRPLVAGESHAVRLFCPLLESYDELVVGL